MKASTARATRPHTPGNVVRLSDYRTPPPASRRAGLSFYEIYPMPFFDKKTRNAWSVQPSGDYSADVETGRQFGSQFVKTCDMTHGWQTLLGVIVNDMARAGPMAERWKDGRPKTNGLIVGFMSVIATYTSWAAGKINGVEGRDHDH